MWNLKSTGLVAISCFFLVSCVSEYDFGKKVVEPTIDSSQQNSDPEPAPETVSLGTPEIPGAPPIEDVPEEAPDSTAILPGEMDMEVVEEPAPTPESSAVPEEVVVVEPSPDTPQFSNCVTQIVQQPSSTETPYPLDLAIVMDTSSSMDTEVAPVTNGIKSYLEGLDPNVDTRVALFNADYEVGKKGRMYSSGGIGPVLKLVPGAVTNRATGTYATPTDLAADFLALMLVETGKHSNTEFGLLSIYSALSNDYPSDLNILSQNQALGFFRSDAALAVITVGDEMDICARSDNGGNGNLQLSTQRSEVSLFPTYCYNANSPQLPNITPANVLQRVEDAYVGRPFNISGIHYLVAGQGGEVGGGYLTLISSVGGSQIDMAAESYTEALNQVATDFNRALEFTTEIQFADPGIESTSIEVVINGIPSDGFTYDAPSQTLHLTDPGPPSARLEITYCTK